MKANDIIFQGTQAKYHIDIKDFNMVAYDFAVTLSYGMTGKTLTINKVDMIQGPDGKWYFKFSTSEMTGFVTAKCKYMVYDTDFEGGLREETNIQTLCFVSTTPCPKLLCFPCEDDMTVSYERTDEGNLSEYDFLRDKNGLLLRTSDGNYLAVQKGIL